MVPIAEGQACLCQCLGNQDATRGHSAQDCAQGHPSQTHHPLAQHAGMQPGTQSHTTHTTHTQETEDSAFNSDTQARKNGHRTKPTAASMHGMALSTLALRTEYWNNGKALYASTHQGTAARLTNVLQNAADNEVPASSHIHASTSLYCGAGAAGASSCSLQAPSAQNARLLPVVGRWGLTGHVPGLRTRTPPQCYTPPPAPKS